MPRASTVVKLVLLGSALALIGWYVWSSWDEGWYGPRHPGYHGGYYYYYHPHSWFTGGGYSGSSRPGPSGITTRGGFGRSGVASAGA